MHVTRRNLLFLPAAIAASAGLRSLVLGQGLEQFATAGPPCDANATPTPSLPRDTAFRPGAPERRSLLDPATVAQAARLNFTGTVSGIRCGRIAGARVDMWHADPQGAFALSGFALRGYQRTASQGEFRFETVMPGAAPGRAPYLGIRVQVPGKAELWTSLFFPDDPRNKNDRRVRKELTLKVIPGERPMHAHFDILFDL
jgi:protocatechuate 3,4-dioxygenase beta subunit